MATDDRIRHVILLMLENRSFDQMIGSVSEVKPTLDGINPTQPRSNPDPSSNEPITQEPNASYRLPDNVDISHEPANVDRQLAFNKDAPPLSGFVSDFRQGKWGGNDDVAQQVMDYFPIGKNAEADRLPALQGLARNFLVCDRWFSSVPGPTWPNRLFALTGTSAGWRAMPNGLEIPGPPYTYDQETVFHRLADKGQKVRVYSSGVSNTIILRRMWWHFSWHSDLKHFFEDVAPDKGETNFPAFALIEPDYFGDDASDQHPPHDVRNGERLIAAVYNALRANKALWESTLLIVTYDEHGGFFDHVLPRPTVSPDNLSEDGFAFDRLGLRVPAVLVSPWLPSDVTHTLFDHTSVLRYVCEKWGAAPLGKRAEQANSLADIFTMGAPNVRSDVPERLNTPQDAPPVASTDLNGNQRALIKAAEQMHASVTTNEPGQGAKGKSRDFSDPHDRVKSLLQESREAIAKSSPIRTVRVLAVHGVGHGDATSKWRDEWRQQIAAEIRSRPGASDWTVEIDFARYDDIFTRYPLGGKQIEDAIVRLTRGLLSGTKGENARGLVPNIPTFNETLRWTAGMVIQWVDEPDLRKELRDRLAKDMLEVDPDIVIAHSLGSLAAYDLFRRQVANGETNFLNGRMLVTLGSQIAHPAVMPVFDGRIEALTTEAGDGFDHWFDLFNEHDLVFTRPIPVNDSHTTTIETDFISLLEGRTDLLNHDAIGYLQHPGTIAVWSNLVNRLNKPLSRSATQETESPSKPLSIPPLVTSRQSRNRALLVGINDYPDPKNRLEGCVNDVFLFSSVLQDFGVEAEDIRVVLDGRATRQGILERLEWLMDGVKDGDTRIFMYSGHGAQIPAYNNRAEPDGYDETLVPYDFDWSREHALTDDDIQKYYSQLPYGLDFLTVLDCCHAGGMARGGLHPRGIDPPDDIRHRAIRWSTPDQMWVPRNWTPSGPRQNRLYVKPIENMNQESNRSSIGMATSIRSENKKQTRKEYGHKGPFQPLSLFACGEDQLAMEYRHGAISYGVFSFVLAKMLRQAKARHKRHTLKAVLDDTAKEINRLSYTQNPEIVGPRKKYSTQTSIFELIKTSK